MDASIWDAFQRDCWTFCHAMTPICPDGKEKCNTVSSNARLAVGHQRCAKFMCHLSSSATLNWPWWSLCPASEDYYGSDTSFCNHWPFALEPTPSFYSIHFINWWAKCLFSFSQDCSLLSGSLAPQSASDWCALQEVLYKGIDTIQYKAFQAVIVSSPALEQ